MLDHVCKSQNILTRLVSLWSCMERFRCLWIYELLILTKLLILDLVFDSLLKWINIWLRKILCLQRRISLVILHVKILVLLLLNSVVNTIILWKVVVRSLVSLGLLILVSISVIKALLRSLSRLRSQCIS